MDQGRASILRINDLFPLKPPLDVFGIYLVHTVVFYLSLSNQYFDGPFCSYITFKITETEQTI